MDKMANRVLSALIAAEGRMAMLRAVASLRLPDAWVAAGAVRNAVWDSLHEYRTSTPLSDIDVVWFDPDDLLALILRPTLPDTTNAPFRERVETKGWLRTWPKLTVVYAT